MPAMMANSRPIIAKPIRKPITGEVIIGTTTFHNRPAPFHHGCADSDQMMAFQSVPAAPSAAPHRPPIRACELEEGSPKYQVIRFQMMPPDSAQISTCEEIG